MDLVLKSEPAWLTYFKIMNDPVALAIIVNPKIIAAEKLS